MRPVTATEERVSQAGSPNPGDVTADIWQRSANVDKNMESNAMPSRAISSYKKGKQNDWKTKPDSSLSPEDKRDT